MHEALANALWNHAESESKILKAKASAIMKLKKRDQKNQGTIPMMDLTPSYVAVQNAMG